MIIASKQEIKDANKVFSSVGEIPKGSIVHLEKASGVKILGIFIRKRNIDGNPVLIMDKLAFTDPRKALSDVQKQQIIAQYLKTTAGRSKLAQSMMQPLKLGPHGPHFKTKNQKQFFAIKAEFDKSIPLIGVKSIEIVPVENLPLFIGYQILSPLMTCLLKNLSNVMAGNQKDIPLEFAKILTEDFWELLC